MSTKALETKKKKLKGLTHFSKEKRKRRVHSSYWHQSCCRRGLWTGQLLQTSNAAAEVPGSGFATLHTRRGSELLGDENVQKSSQDERAQKTFEEGRASKNPIVDPSCPPHLR